MRSEGLATIDNVAPSVLVDGREENLRMSKTGELFTSDWKQRLLLSGHIWSITIGTLAINDTGFITEIQGGGANTICEQNEPECSIGVPAGYFLIPISCRISCHGDWGAADANEFNAIFFTDRTAVVPTDGTKTAYAALNCLDGGPAFPGLAYSECTGAMTAPTISDVLDYVCAEASQVTAAGVVSGGLKMNYEPEVPVCLAGPCSIYVMWGGTTAQYGICNVVFGCVPSSWFPIV